MPIAMSRTAHGLAGPLTRVFVACSFALLTACGGGGGGGGSSGAGTGTGTPPIVTPVAPTPSEASRFLAQATFGANDADISAVTAGSYDSWISSQIATAPTAGYLTWMDSRLPALQAANATASVSANQFYEAFWMKGATASDQLRQRVAFALSEIFVTSFSSNVDTRGMAAYYDMLNRDALGNFRTLLQDVTYQPSMGIYLTYLGNQKENASTGRTPDENYAREVMQLMTIGLYELNIDGTQKKDLLGNSIPTYTTSDVKNLAKVFTGLSYYNPTPTNSTFFGGSRDAEAYTKPMLMYNAYHSTSAKTFLGTTIAATTTADGTGEVNTALDTLFNNANVAPFISRQLIQRLVTSNPSAAYVRRVATIFNNNGAGVRGDMSAVVRAILLDSEARTVSGDADYGKIREPVIRLANWMRAFEATSTSGNWLMTSTSAQTSLDQAPLTSPSVFNFFRPGYQPPNTLIGNKNLEAPEFQITDEVTTASYINTMQNAIQNGVGSSSDIKSSYTKEIALSGDATALVDRVNLLLGANLSAGLKAKISTAVSAIAIPTTGAQSTIDAAKLNRVRLTILLAMASPEYLAQK